MIELARKLPLGEVLRLEATVEGSRMLGGPRRSKKGFFLRAETAFSMMENLGGVPGYWEDNTAEMSHGEGFLAVFGASLEPRGASLNHLILSETPPNLSASSHAGPLAWAAGVRSASRHPLRHLRWGWSRRTSCTWPAAPTAASRDRNCIPRSAPRRPHARTW